DYVTVVECKHQRRPVEGEEIDVLATKVRRYGHKGLLVSTGGFQSGARKRAKIEKIALVHMTTGGPRWLARERDGFPGAPVSTHDFYLVTSSIEDTASYRPAQRSALLEVLFGSASAGALRGPEGGD
ncbi:MAG TPA: restriction endonuclease, partial [Longimicrobium sp.]